MPSRRVSFLSCKEAELLAALEKRTSSACQPASATPPSLTHFTVRLAWHASGTYDKFTRTGGSAPGTIRFKEELAHGANAGLDKPIAWLEPVHAANPSVSYADLIAFAGVVAVETMGGPTIPFRSGRLDTMDPSLVTPDGRLPEADQGGPPKTAAALRAVFGRMGFDDRELVALSGAHALGRCHVVRHTVAGWNAVLREY